MLFVPRTHHPGWLRRDVFPSTSLGSQPTHLSASALWLLLALAPFSSHSCIPVLWRRAPPRCMLCHSDSHAEPCRARCRSVPSTQGLCWALTAGSESQARQGSPGRDAGVLVMLNSGELLGVGSSLLVRLLPSHLFSRGTQNTVTRVL